MYRDGVHMKELNEYYRSLELYEREDASLSVQSFINNISFPESLDELRVFIYEHGCFNVEDILENEEEVWTVPKWAKPGDIVFFMHSKTAIAKISALTTALKNNINQYSSEEYNLMSEWLHHGRRLYERFGGKIFAIGRVKGEPIYENYQDDDEVHFHWSSRIYADIDSVIVLESPVDISEFNSFILVSRGSAVTPVFGEQFERLRDVISKNNRLPRYVRDSVSIPIPLREINKDNWIEIAGKYKRSFFLEIQFRSFYVDYLLELLGDQKKFYRECRCVKPGNPDSFVDNIIKINGSYLPVEIKIDINAEKDINNQVIKYCNVEKCYLNNKETNYIDYKSMYSQNVLIIDTFCIYMYDVKKNKVSMLYKLDDLKNKEEITVIKNTIIDSLA